MVVFIVTAAVKYRHGSGIYAYQLKDVPWQVIPGAVSTPVMELGGDTITGLHAVQHAFDCVSDSPSVHPEIL
jgi:hypothetical protein